MKMNICLASDNNFARYMGTTITSILKSSNEGDEFVFHIMDGKISNNDKNKIEELKNIKNFEIKYYTPDYELAQRFFSKHKRDKHFTSAVMYRLFIPEIIKDVDKILYLDSDMVVVDSLSELFNIDFENKHALVVDIGVIDRKTSNNYPQEEIRYNYFNSGFMMINNRLWRETNIMTDFKSFWDSVSSLDWVDETILNNVLKDKVKFIHRKYNFSAHVGYSNPLKDVNEEKVIIHYLGGQKPWSDDARDLLFTNYFWKYYILTPWFRDYPAEAVSIMIRQNINSSTRINKIDKRTEKFVNALIWIIPIKKIRDKIRKYFLM